MATGGQGAADFDRGRRVGKYEILTRLSLGGMAELFLAFTAGPGGFRKFVALKQILPDIKKDESFVKMFLDEARITAALSHANIGQVYDLGIEEGELYLAMEFIAGQNLEQVAKAALKKGVAIPLGFSCRAVRDSALALHYAHHFVDPTGTPSPVIHRDISPKNVMVTYQGAVKVIDFGIAKAKGRLNRTQVGMVKGTSGYMSPEQVRNQQLDGRSDLFSLGVMLHEFLTGQRLFAAANDGQMMLAIAEGPIPNPRELNPQVPAELAAVAMKALSRKKDERYATGKELAKALEAASSKFLHEDEQCAALMKQLFGEKMEKTRALLELASRPAAADQALAISEFAGALSAEEGEKTPPSGRPPPARSSGKTPAVRGQKTPSARAAAPAADEDDERTVPPTARPPKASTPRPRPQASSDRFKSQVAEEYALYSEAEEATETVSSKKGPARAEEQSTDPHSTAVRPRLPPPPQAGASSPGRGSGVVKWLVVLLLLGGVGYSPFAPPPVGEKVRGLFGTAKQLVAKEMAGEPPPPKEGKLQLPESEMNALQLQLKEQRELEQRQREHELKQAELAARQLAEMAKLDAGARVAGAIQPAKAKAGAKAQAEGAAAGARKQVAAKAPADKALDPDQVDVLDTSSEQAALKDGVGWLTLYTVPPAAVFDAEVALGTAPLIKVPFPSGVYRLRVVDPEGGDRLLSVPIKAGQVTDMKIRVSDLPVSK